MMRAAETHPGHHRLSLGQSVLALFYRCVSKHAKHVFFIASLHGQYSHYAKHQRMAIEKLNEIMALAYRPDALHFPAALHDKVWGQSGIDKILTEKAIRCADSDHAVKDLAIQIVDGSPKWSRYAPREEMIQDISLWIRSLHDHYKNIS